MSRSVAIANHQRELDQNQLSQPRFELTVEQTRVMRELEAALYDNYFPALKELEIEFDQDRLKISGSLPTYYEKQIACSLSRRIIGDWDLLDQITVN